MQLSRELDWVAKLELLEGYRDRGRPGLGRIRGCSWSTCSTPTSGPTGASTTGWWPGAGWSGSSPTTRGRRGPSRNRRRTPGPTSAAAACSKYAESVAAASWDSVIFDIPGRESLQRVPTLEPLRGTKAHVGELLDRCRSAAELVAALTGHDDPRGAVTVRPVRAVGRGIRGRDRSSRPCGMSDVRLPITGERPRWETEVAHGDEGQGGQRQTTRRDRGDRGDRDRGAEDVKERQEKLSDDVDAILDEIDEVLEENAEEFVRSYVQKGGQ